VSARTFQVFLSKRFHNFELAYLVTLVSALYEDSIQLNGSQTDLLYKSNWDEIAKQMFNAARIIRSLTKLKYSTSTDPKSEFIQKLVKIQYHKKFERLSRRIEQDQEDITIADGTVTRRDYILAVKALFNVLEALYDIYERSLSRRKADKVICAAGSDFDCTDMSNNPET